MKLRLLALAATAAAATLAATGALADTVIATAVQGVNITEPLITEFNSDQSGLIVANGYTFTQGPNAQTFDGHLGLISGVSAPPPADNLGPVGAMYETVEGNGSATLAAATGMLEFQFYMGSPDEYNSVSFAFADSATPVVLNGDALWGGHPVGNGDQSQGFTVSYHFDAPVTAITFTSSQNSFEFDKLAGGVPEPTSWALMMLGFGGAGAVLRGQRRRQAVAATA